MKRFISILTASLAVCASAAANDGVEAFTPEGMERARDEFQYSPVVRAGDYIFLAGVVAGVPPKKNGEPAEITPESLEAAYDRAFARIAAILEAAGADWSDVVEMTTFHTDLRGQGGAFMAAKKRYVSEPYPAWTAIDIDRLWPDAGLTEIKVVAYKPRQTSG